jgi:hypothetical protein
VKFIDEEKYPRMTVKFLEYSLVNGFVDHWLLAGPQLLVSLPDEPLVAPSETPAERFAFSTGGQNLIWEYYRCLQDHLIDLSSEYTSKRYGRAWAYVQLKAQAPGEVVFELYASGPVAVSLNGELVYQGEPPQDSKGHAALIPHRFRAQVQAENVFFVRFESFGMGATPHRMALRLPGFSGTDQLEAIKVLVPTQARFPHRQKFFENLFDKAYLERFVSYKGTNIPLRWAEDAEMTTSYAYKVRDTRKQIYIDGKAEVKLEVYDAGHPQRLWERPYQVALQASEMEYWNQDLRYEQLLDFQVLDNAYVLEAKDSYVQRRQELLQHASRREGRLETNLYTEIASMIQGEWERVNTDMILQAAAQVNQKELDSAGLLVALLGMVARYKDDSSFPKAELAAVQAAALEFDYAQDGLEESQAILVSAAAILAGQRYPRRAFPKAGVKGAQLCRQAEQSAVAWMRQRAQQGFTLWNSPAALSEVVVALTHLTSLAEDASVRELSAVLLDKVLFLLAVNSFQGIYGVAQSRADALSVKSAQLLPTAGIHRLLFGAGVYNHHLAAPVSLACSNYEYPNFFAEIAAKSPPELLHLERQVGSDGQAANLVSYRTPDYMLSSVQDYRPGQPGVAEHVWQATLGPDAIVYTNHPGGMGEQAGLEPGFWLGNAALPRVAQWKNNLVAVYNLPQDDWMGFTHAYFPAYAFDETVFARGWAFARLGDAFLGITCSQGFEQVKNGSGAYRELRSAGLQNVWLCVMGRLALDRGFRKFQKRCMAIKPDWQALGVSFTSPHGDDIAFGWEGPLLVNGEAQPLDGFKHMQNPYCTTELGASQMDIQYGDVLMRLNFE